MRHAVVAVWALMLALAPPAFAGARNVVEATGEGEITVVPDQAILTLGVTTDAPTARQALEDNARSMTSVLGALAQAGFSPPDVATRTVSLTPLTEHRPNAEPKIVAYRASNTVQVKTRDPASIGRALDAGVQAGANVSGGIAFGLADPRAAETQALRLAAQDAQRRATAMAEALGLKLGRVVELRATEIDRPVPRFEAMQARAASVPTPIEPGLITVRARAVVKAELR